jgi:hypothetical protein
VLILVVLKVKVMVFNTTFNNISVLSWHSVLLVEEIKVPGENRQPAELDNYFSVQYKSTVWKYRIYL